MALSHSLHLDRRGDAQTVTRTREREGDAVREGEPTALGGRVMNLGLVLMAVLWVVSLVQLLRLPAQGPLATTGEAAVWTALAIASAISTFLLGVWKVHRS
ncbi:MULTISPECIES: hypothetical protein [unclassified Aeromicrobium]|uniref:hypothetical protein n=1 Tax=unclassified Aeromicrobium TaxID=2633570 RepID=UPI00396B11D5